MRVRVNVRRKSVLRLITVFIAVAWMSSTAQRPVSAAPTTVRVLQWNTYHGGYGTDGVYDQDRQVSWMAGMAPDLISLNEVTVTQAAAYAQKLTAATGITWWSFHVVAQSDGSGNQILSRYPLIRTSIYRMQTNGQYARAVAQATIDAPGGALNFFSVHLEHADPVIRRAQVAELEAFTSGFGEPGIIAGDFNAGPDTQEVERIASGWVDAWQNGVETDAAAAYGPDNPASRYTRTLRERIDYILVAERSGLSAGAGEKPDTRDLSNTRVTRLLQTSDDKGVRPSDHNPFVAAVVVGAPPPVETTPPSVSMLAPLAGDDLSGAVTVSAQAFDNAHVMKVQLLVDGVRTRTDRWAPYDFALDTNTLASGAHTLEVVAVDDSGNTGSSGPVHVSVGSAALSTDEIVLYAAEGVPGGKWTKVADGTAAGGLRLVHPNADVAKLTTALATPVHYFETTFEAAAGRPYHLWMRLKAEKDYWGNDSVFLQFDHAVTATGVPAYAIGTTAAAEVNLEDCSGCGLAGWGWQDNGWGVGVMGQEIRFATHGTQRIRVQTREDGVSIDQIVLSSARFLTTAPGPLKNDTTLLPKTGGALLPANALPSVALTAPVTGDTFTAPARIAIAAQATDSDGTVAQVEFFAGTTSLGTATTSPFAIEWSNVPAGNYLLRARATDDSGATTESAAVSVSVTAAAPANLAPTVSIVSPAAGAAFTAPASITIAIDARDADGTVARVDFYAGATLIGSTTVAPFSYAWTNVPGGNYSLTAHATDAAGAVTVSQPVAVSVVAPPPPAPAPPMSLTASLYKLKNVKGTTLAWSGSKAASIAVYRNGQLIANVGNTGGYVDIIARPAGSYEYKVCEIGTSTCSNTATIRF